MDADPGDASLLCQYVRLLILSTDPAYRNFIQSPLHSDGDFYWAEGVARKAAEIAAGLDPQCREYLAEVILASFAERLESALEEERGFIGQGRTLHDVSAGRYRYYRGVELSMVEVCFQSPKLSPEIAKRWVGRYTQLTDSLVKKGKVASAMMLGNLTGELIQGGPGTEDFKLANKAFLESLEFYQPDGEYDWIEEAAEAYPACFRSELLETQSGKIVDPLFDQLRKELESRSVPIPQASETSPRNLSAPTGAAP